MGLMLVEPEFYPRKKKLVSFLLAVTKSTRPNNSGLFWLTVQGAYSPLRLRKHLRGMWAVDLSTSAIEK